MKSPDRDRDLTTLEWIKQKITIGYLQVEHILPSLFRAMLDLIPECRKQWDDEQLRAAKFKHVIGEDIKVVADAILTITEAAKPNDESDDEQDRLWQGNDEIIAVEQDPFDGTAAVDQLQDSGIQENCSIQSLQMDIQSSPGCASSSTSASSTSTTTRRISKRLQEGLLTCPDTKNTPDEKRRKTMP